MSKAHDYFWSLFDPEAPDALSLIDEDTTLIEDGKGVKQSVWEFSDGSVIISRPNEHGGAINTYKDYYETEEERDVSAQETIDGG